MRERTSEREDGSRVTLTDMQRRVNGGDDGAGVSSAIDCRRERRVDDWEVADLPDEVG